MKKYFLGLGAIVLALTFSAFTIKAKPTSVFDLVFTGNPGLESSVENEANYRQNGTHAPGYVCGALIADQAACKLLSVDEKYTHSNGLGSQVLNIGIAGVISTNNPQGEQILTVDASSNIVCGGTYWRIEQLNYSDALSVTRTGGGEDVKMENGAVADCFF